MTTLGDNVLSGDATYAMGRWVKSTATRTSDAETLTGAGDRSHHDVTLNAPAAFPTSGAKTCDAGVFTTPTYASGSNSAGGTGTVSGSVSLGFGADGASIAGSLVVDVAGSKGSVPLQGKATGVTTAIISAAYLSNGAGAAIQIGDAGGDAYLVVASYAATLANGARYIGVAKFRCA